jgi:hypothetical protein
MKVKELTEAQVFDWANAKISIISFIKDRLSGEENGTSRLRNKLYEIITNTVLGSLGSAQKLGFTDEYAEKIYVWSSQPPFLHDDTWAQVNFNSDLPKKTDDDYNYYITIAKDRDNIVLFYRSYSKLFEILKKLSVEEQTPIKFKTHRKLNNMVTHNDSLKIYFNDPSLKNDVENAVKEWIRVSGVKTAPRTHVHGVDRYDTGEGRSYGMILADSLTKIFVDNIDKNGNKFTPEEYYDWLKKYFVQMIQSVKPRIN